MRVTNKIKEEQIRILGEVYKDAKPALIFHNPFELLIAVILSAQCTDKRVNVTTARLFKKVTMPEDIMDMGLEKLEEEIRDCGLYHNKAKNIMGACQELCNKFQGRVPADFELLMELPGVGRKTANVVMGAAFGKATIPVDTHVYRVSHRLGLSKGKTPNDVEKDLGRHIPEALRFKAHHWILLHGRYVCKALKPDCLNCGIQHYCKQYSR